MDKKIGQVVLMVVLLAVLGFSTMYMLNTINKPKRSSPSASAAAAAGVAKDTEAQTSSRAAGGSKNVSDEDRKFNDPDLNPNVFRAYAIDSPRNPFVQDVDWYSDILAENLPGWGDLRESDYFDDFTPSLPDMEFLKDKEWLSASVQRRRDNAYTISGESEDGRIQTQISLEEDVPAQSSYSWSAASGVPFEMAMNPEYVRQAAASQPSTPSGDLRLPDLPDFFNGLPPPGSSLPGPDQLGGGVVNGNVITCKGVSIDGNRATALMDVNGEIKLVTRGQMLPPRYKVQEITIDGVILQDIQDETTEWIPITSSSSEDFPTS